MLRGEEGFCALSPGARFRGLLAHPPLPVSVAVGPPAGAGCAGFVSLGFRHSCGDSWVPEVVSPLVGRRVINLALSSWPRVSRAEGQLSPHGDGGREGPGSSAPPRHTLAGHLLCAGSMLDAGSSELNETQPLTSGSA